MPRTDLVIDGRSAAITGAARGIGRAIAAALADAGLTVAVNDLDADALEEAEADLDGCPGEVVTVPGDATDPAVTEGLVEAAVGAGDGLDVLVNNVGVPGPTAPTEALTRGEFMATLEGNLGAMHGATAAAIPYLRASEAGRIVNVSSRSGKRPHPNRLPYATAKMGVIGFTRTLAVELAPDGVLVNAVCPGVVAGDRLDRVIRAHAEHDGRPVAAVEREFRAESPLDELTRPGDVADLVLFLCSRRAARITGQDLNVTAGRVMY